MTDYSSLSAEPKQFHALTAYTLEEFDALLPTFAERFRGPDASLYLGGQTPPAALCQL